MRYYKSLQNSTSFLNVPEKEISEKCSEEMKLKFTDQLRLIHHGMILSSELRSRRKKKHFDEQIVILWIRWWAFKFRSIFFSLHLFHSVINLIRPNTHKIHSVITFKCRQFIRGSSQRYKCIAQVVACLVFFVEGLNKWKCGISSHLIVLLSYLDESPPY